MHALAEMPSTWRLDMYGTGAAAGRIRRLARRLGVSDRVHLRGERPREEIFAALERADALLFPSMHDSSPYAVAEAVRAGCPVVCLDVGGPPALISDTPGIAVRPDARAPRRLADAMACVRRHPPSNRWSASRQPALVNRWYAEASQTLTGRPTGAARPSPAGKRPRHARPRVEAIAASIARRWPRRSRAGSPPRRTRRPTQDSET